MDPQRLRAEQVRRSLKQAGKLRALNVPAGGWLRAVREALGIPLRALAARIGISSTTLITSERNEASGAISLKQLRKIAAAMECEVVYALVPRRDLLEMVEARAEELARAEILSVTHSMALEDQRPDNAFVRKQVEARKRQLLEGNWARLWR